MDETVTVVQIDVMEAQFDIADSDLSQAPKISNIEVFYSSGRAHSRGEQFAFGDRTPARRKNRDNPLGTARRAPAKSEAAASQRPGVANIAIDVATGPGGTVKFDRTITSLSSCPSSYPLPQGVQ